MAGKAPNGSRSKFKGTEFKHNSLSVEMPGNFAKGSWKGNCRSSINRARIREVTWFLPLFSLRIKDIPKIFFSFGREKYSHGAQLL